MLDGWEVLSYAIIPSRANWLLKHTEQSSSEAQFGLECERWGLGFRVWCSCNAGVPRTLKSCCGRRLIHSHFARNVWFVRYIWNPSEKEGLVEALNVSWCWRDCSGGPLWLAPHREREQGSQISSRLDAIPIKMRRSFMVPFQKPHTSDVLYYG